MNKLKMMLLPLMLMAAGHTWSAVGSGAVNVPADQQVLFILGQDTSTLRDFNNEVLSQSGNNFPAPAGVTLYSSLLPVELGANSAPADAAFYISGIEGPPADQGNGEVNFAQTLGAYDQAAQGEQVALAVGLYLSDEWADCGNQPLRAIAGTGDPDVGSASDPTSLTSQYRYAMDRMIQYFKNDGRPVYLRIGYEFDGPWNCYNQTFYKQAFRWIAERIDQLNADNVATVWQSATYPDDGDPAYDYDVSNNPYQHYSEWYPGDDVVDWVGISFFAGSNYLSYQWSCQDSSQPWTVPDISPRALQNVLVDFARDHGKPAMIAESAPQGFDLNNKTYSCTASRATTSTFAGSQALWDAFFLDYFDWIEQNADQIRAFSYINTDWQSQSRWYCAPGAATCAEGYWGVTSLQDDAVVMANTQARLQQSLYMTATDLPLESGSGNSSQASNSSSSNSSSDTSSSSSSSSSSSVSSSSESSSEGGNSCPVSHPFQCGGACYVDAAQAQSAGCTGGSGGGQSSQSSASESGSSGGQCPSSHPYWAEQCQQCFVDLNQATSAGCGL